MYELHLFTHVIFLTECVYTLVLKIVEPSHEGEKKISYGRASMYVSKYVSLLNEHSSRSKAVTQGLSIPKGFNSQSKDIFPPPIKCLAHARACECVYPLLYEAAYKREKMPQAMYTHMLACWIYTPLNRQVVLVGFDIWHI